MSRNVFTFRMILCADHRGPPGDPMSTGEALIVRIGCGGVMFELGHAERAMQLRLPPLVAPVRLSDRDRKRFYSFTHVK